METNHELGDSCKPVETPFGDLTDAKRPLESTLGVLKRASMITKTPTADQAETQLAMSLVI